MSLWREYRHARSFRKPILVALLYARERRAA